jgi:hypothetical protein
MTGIRFPERGYIFFQNTKVEEDDMGGACSTNGEEKRVQVIGGKARGKEPLGRPRQRWADNIKTELGEVG